MSERPIAITGATGALGGAVVRQLAGRGVPMRLIVRDADLAPKVPGADVAVADLGDASATAEALAGVRTLFLVSAGEGRDRQQAHDAAVRGAATAGIERVVYTSFLGASPRASFTFARDHCHTEVAIRGSGMALTSLRNSLYADIVPHLVQDGVIRGPAGDGRIAWVAREDIARLAVTTLLDDAHADRIYDVTGPEPIDLHRTATQLSAACGREVRYEPETVADARSSRAGAEDWQIDGWIGSYLAIATGEAGVTSHTIEALTGQRPWSFEEFLAARPDVVSHLRS